MAGRTLKDGPGDCLNDENWPRWSDQMLAFLFLKGCDRWVLEELPADSDPEDVLLAKQAEKWIKLCVSPRWARRIKGMTSPFLIWREFENFYVEHLRANMIEIQQKVFSLRQGPTQSIDDYMDEILLLNDSLDAMDMPLPEHTMVSHVISTLNSSLSSARSMLKLNAANYNMTSLRTALCSISRESKPPQQDTRANLVMRPPRGNQGNKGRARSNSSNTRSQGEASTCSNTQDTPFKEKFCNHCGNKGHIAPFCLLKMHMRLKETNCSEQPKGYAAGYPDSG